ncbi:MAG: hypothetical protein UR15_C0008G0010 [Parcubacteria group bacterium GW2011_GWA2_31_28]|nr:MAG: hypothetical protein UR15_C0008G0010 [Parcubacteria group bacterium GW2011_GWA2_31_28]
MISLKRLSDFEDLGKNRLPVFSPFQSVWYQKVFAHHFSTPDTIIILGVYEDETLICYGIFEKMDKTAIFLGMKKILGNQEVTDYGDIIYEPAYSDRLGDIWSLITEYFKQEDYDLLQLDYMRRDSLSYSILHNENKESELKSISPYIDLPFNWEDYLNKLDRKNRHELKRKLKRIAQEEHEYSCYENPNDELFNEFVRLQRLSSEEKKHFMTKEMKSFFYDLIKNNDIEWKTKLCFLKIKGKNAACLMTFENDKKVLVYNSGFDPEFKYYSVGLVLHVLKIQQSIGLGKNIYDFLRGSERYKYDLGGKDCQLEKFNIRLRK